MLMEELVGLGTQEMTTVSMTRSVFYFSFHASDGDSLKHEGR